MQELQYPLSAFKHVFEKLAAATHLRLSVPDSTLDWLSQLSSDEPQRTTSGFTPEEQLVLKNGRMSTNTNLKMPPIASRNKTSRLRHWRTS